MNIAIIGGGIGGLAVAYNLAKNWPAAKGAPPTGGPVMLGLRDSSSGAAILHVSDAALGLLVRGDVATANQAISLD